LSQPLLCGLASAISCRVGLKPVLDPDPGTGFFAFVRLTLHETAAIDMPGHTTFRFKTFKQGLRSLVSGGNSQAKRRSLLRSDAVAWWTSFFANIHLPKMPKATFNDYNAAAAFVNLLLQFPCLLHLSWSFVGNLKFLKVHEKIQ